MKLRVVGAGLGRTGTHSLKIALEQLLGGPCYHMIEVFGHPEHVPLWRDAALGKEPDWDALFADYVATVDWPGAAVWSEMSAHYPDAIVLLSVRDSADAWWKSASNTIFKAIPEHPEDDWGKWAVALIDGHIGSHVDPEIAKAGYERHNAEVRATIPSSRLLEWNATDGWAPLCEALGVPIPDEPFPVTNTTEEFNARRMPPES